MTYVAIDGDNIGASIERLVILERRDELSRYSQLIESSIASIANALRAEGASIVFTGGDSVLAEFTESTACNAIQDVLAVHYSMPFSAGAGKTIREAYLALKIAKTSGKGRLVWFDTLGEAEDIRQGDCSDD